MGRTSARNYALGLASQGFHLFTAFFLYGYLARTLGPGGFGDWRVVLTVLSWFELVVSDGIAKAAVKAIAENPDEARSIGRATYLGQIAAAAGAFLVLALAAGPLATALGDPMLRGVLLIAALDLPAFALFQAASAVLLGRKRFQRQAVAWMVYASSKAVLIALLATGSLGVTGAFVGNVLSSLVGLAAMVAPLPAGMARASATIEWTRRIARSSSPLLALALLHGALLSADLWIVSAVFGSGARVGRYASATLLAEVPVFLFVGLNRVIFPSVAGAIAAGDVAEADRNTLVGVRTALIVTTFAVMLAFAAGGPLLAFLFSRAYADAAAALTLIMVASMGRTVLATTTEILMARNRRGIAIAVLVATVASSIASVALLARPYGLVGAAGGAAVTAVGGAMAASLALRTSLGVRPLATLARSVAAAALSCVPLALVPIGSGWLVPTIAGSSAGYLLLLWLFRELSAADVAAIREGLGRGGTHPESTVA